MARTPPGTPPRPSAASSSVAAAVPAGRLSTYRPAIDRTIFALSLAGLAVVSHIAFQSARGFAGGCAGFDPNNMDAAPSGCATVLSSAYATTLGVSNTLLGLVFYGLVALLSAAMVVAPEMLPMLKRVRGGILVVGAAYALYLVGVLLSGAAGGLCALCLTSHALTVAMAALFAFDVLRPETAPTLAARR